MDTYFRKGKTIVKTWLSREGYHKQYYEANKEKYKGKYKAQKTGSKEPISLDRLKQLVGYCKDKGLYRLDGTTRAGKENNKYRYIVLDGKRYPVHSIVLYYHTGRYPKIVDHINGLKHDNRIENLRESDYRQNALNRHIHRELGKLGEYLTDTTENFKKRQLKNLQLKYADNIHYEKARNKWVFEIVRNGVRTRKRFNTKEEAQEYSNQVLIK